MIEQSVAIGGRNHRRNQRERYVYQESNHGQYRRIAKFRRKHLDNRSAAGEGFAEIT